MNSNLTTGASISTGSGATARGAAGCGVGSKTWMPLRGAHGHRADRQAQRPAVQQFPVIGRGSSYTVESLARSMGQRWSN